MSAIQFYPQVILLFPIFPSTFRGASINLHRESGRKMIERLEYRVFTCNWIPVELKQNSANKLTTLREKMCKVEFGIPDATWGTHTFKNLVSWKIQLYSPVFWSYLPWNVSMAVSNWNEMIKQKSTKQVYNWTCVVKFIAAILSVYQYILDKKYLGRK